MSKGLVAVAVAGSLALCWQPVCAHAQNGRSSVAAKPAPTGPFSSAIMAYRKGIAAVRAGAIKAAVPALKFAADQGVLGAQLQLAELYAVGHGVKRNDAKAFYYYRKIADEYADITPMNPVAKYVAGAFVALGRYELVGIRSLGLAPDPEHAADLFRHAASYFGDAEAQYELGRLYLSGRGVDRDVRVGANWLALAARKQDAQAQATLGELLWRGEKDRPSYFKNQPRYVRGLALIALAHYNLKASGKKSPWIERLYITAFHGLDDTTRRQVEAIVPRWGGPKVAIVPMLPAATTEAKAEMPATHEAEKTPMPKAVRPVSTTVGAASARSATETTVKTTDEANVETASGSAGEMSGGEQEAVGMSMGFSNGASAPALHP